MFDLWTLPDRIGMIRWKKLEKVLISKANDNGKYKIFCRYRRQNFLVDQSNMKKVHSFSTAIDIILIITKIF